MHLEQLALLVFDSVYWHLGVGVAALIEFLSGLQEVRIEGGCSKLCAPLFLLQLLHPYNCHIVLLDAPV